MGGSSIGKVPGDVPRARGYFFGLLVYPKVYFLQFWSSLGLAKGIIFDNIGLGTAFESRNFILTTNFC